MSRALRCLIVDDEPLARHRLRGMLATLEAIEIAGECEDGNAAIAAIEAQRPEVLFLDVAMPEVSGLDVLERIERSELPVVIFTTAYDEYAIQAFDAHAIDYLLKPIEPARLAESVDRARRIVEAFAAPPRYRTRIAVTRGSRYFVLRVARIDWIESEGNYARLHLGNESFLLRSTLHALEAELDPNDFLRIGRSTIVNLNRVAEIAEQTIVLADGTRLNVQRPYAARLRASMRA